MTEPEDKKTYDPAEFGPVTADTTEVMQRIHIEQPSRQQPCLLFLTGFEAGRVQALGFDPRSWTIGRNDDCDVILNNPEISRLHAHLELHPDGSVHIRDEGSVNGTFVNNYRVEEEALHSDDKVQFGPYVLLKLVFQDEEELHHYQQLHARATTDHLTALMNRRSFFQALQREWSYAKRHLKQLALIMLDIDLFKHVNDTYGHMRGDEVLVEFSNRVKNQTRVEDYIARLGGEEFAVLLRETDLQGAMIVAQRVRKAIADTPFNLSTGESVTITVSGGVTSYGPRELHQQSTEDFVADADAQLYQAKESGRDRVCSH
jgi:diguanylate cyclase (GGDEF)-like protein